MCCFLFRTNFGTNNFIPSVGQNSFGPNSLNNNLNTPNPPSVQTTTQDPSTLGCGTPVNNCDNSQYRSFDGSCNNLQNPVWGTPNTRYNRLLPAIYGDGK